MFYNGVPIICHLIVLEIMKRLYCIPHKQIVQRYLYIEAQECNTRIYDCTTSIVQVCVIQENINGPKA